MDSPKEPKWLLAMAILAVVFAAVWYFAIGVVVIHFLKKFW